MRLPIILLLSALLAGCGGNEEQTSPAPGGPSKPQQATEMEGTGRLDRSHAGSAAPSMLFENPAGEPASLADFRGKPVLVNLWATWCAPCVAEMPTLDQLAAENGNIHVLAISQDLNGQEKVDAFFEQRKFARLEPYVDAELAMMTGLGIGTLPTTILYDADGREVWRMTGMEDWTGERAAALIAEATPG